MRVWALMYVCIGRCNFLFVHSLLGDIFIHFLLHTDLDVRGKEEVLTLNSINIKEQAIHS